MNWRIKGVVQKTLSLVPAGTRVNDRLQSLAGDLRNFDSNVDKKVVADWCVLASHMAELNCPLKNLDYLEIGTGWYPTSPICYFLAGARRCLTFDVNRHLNAAWTFRMLRRIEMHLPAIAASGFRPLPEVEAAYSTLKTAGTLDELLRRARIEYHAPADAADSALPPASVDVVFSNSVLEHVPPDAIQRLMVESHRVLRSGGLAIHSANCGDHYAYFDRGISAMNYLTYSSDKWRFWNNSLLYQNRLRPQDFLDMAEQADLCVVLTKFRPRPELLAILPTLEIAPEFAHYPPEQLAATSIDFVGQRN